MLAIQNGAVNWVHQDPVTKSQRVTNSSGAVISTIDLDPWGGETNRSANSAFQPHKYTTYERDGNGGDDAMMRRYQSNWTRFSQPDPYDGSYSLAAPQSLNRYAYVENDPVNFTDPSGLLIWDGFPDYVIRTNTWARSDFPWDFFFRSFFGNGLRPHPIEREPREPRERPEPPQKTLDDKEIQRRIAEGQAWDKWYAWVNCNTPIMNKYNAQIKDFLKIGGEAFWWEVGAGFGAATTILGAGFGSKAGIMDGGPPVGAWGVALIIVGVHFAERKRINDIKSEYQKEVTKNCGPKPPHP
jgi:RHS repeat-associated protein